MEVEEGSGGLVFEGVMAGPAERELEDWVVECRVKDNLGRMF